MKPVKSPQVDVPEQDPPPCMRIVGWEGEEPKRCGGAQRWAEVVNGRLKTRCRACGAQSAVRPDHAAAAWAGEPYNLGWRDYRPKKSRRWTPPERSR